MRNAGLEEAQAGIKIAAAAAAAAAMSFQSFPTLCHPADGSPPASAVPGILQARTWFNAFGIQEPIILKKFSKHTKKLIQGEKRLSNWCHRPCKEPA